jgi:hypothetical protein
VCEDLCEELAVGTTEDARGAWDELSRGGRLWEHCRACRDDAESLPRLEECLAHLSRAAADTQCLQRLRIELSAPRRLVAAAALVNRVPNRTRLREPEAELLHWARVAVTLEEGEAPAQLPDGWFGTEAEVLDRCFAALRRLGQTDPRSLAAARAAALCLLDYPGSRRSDNIPILLVAPGGEVGEVARLSLCWLPGGSGHLLPASQNFRWLGAAWVRSLEALGRFVASDADVVWDVSGRDDLDGPSAQAAFRIALELLHRARTYDVGCAISAALGANLQGGLIGVAGVVADHGEAGPKLTAARQAGLRRVVIASADREKLRGPPPAGLEVVQAATVDEALELASREANWLGAHLAAVQGLPERNFWAQDAFRRNLTDLFVEPDLIHWERRPPDRDRSADNGGPQDGSRSENRTHFGRDVLDIGEAEELLFLERRGEQERRLSWGEFRRLLAAPGARACVVAPPGQGKTTLARMLGRELAEEAARPLAAQQSGATALPLPLVVELRQLVDGAPATIVNPDQLLERHLRRVVQGNLAGLGEQAEGAAAWLAGQARQDRGWLLLDGLDEVTADANAPEHKLLQEFFGVLARAGWRCRLLITTRPNGLGSWALPPVTPVYRLAPLSAGQQATLVKRWGGSPLGRERIDGLRARSPVVQEMAQNPLLLSYVCAVAETVDLVPEVRRTELYGHILGLMLGQRFADEVLDLLEELAWLMFSRNANNVRLSERELLRRIERSPRFRNRNPLDVRDDLLRRRILVRLGASGDVSFSHRSLGEYLAGSYLAQSVNYSGWEVDLPHTGGGGGEK